MLPSGLTLTGNVETDYTVNDEHGVALFHGGYRECLEYLAELHEGMAVELVPCYTTVTYEVLLPYR